MAESMHVWTAERFFESYEQPEHTHAYLEQVREFIARQKRDGRRVALVTVRTPALCVG